MNRLSTLIIHFSLLFLSISSEQNSPSKYIRSGGRVFQYRAISFRISTPSGSSSTRYRVVALVNGVQSYLREVTLNGGTTELTNSQDNIIWGEDVGDYAFTRFITFTLNIMIGSTDNIYDSFEINLDLNKGIPLRKSIVGRLGHIESEFYFLVRCENYGGVNCRLNYDNLASNLKYNFYTGEMQCRNGKENPPRCDLDPPSTTGNSCLNGGTAIMITQDDYYCNCPSGFRGSRCENFYCGSSCVHPNGNCTGPNICLCNNGFNGNDCSSLTCDNYTLCVNGVCEIKNNHHRCKCEPGYFGNLCEYKCDPSCLHGICYVFEGRTHCKCDDNYIGDICNIALNDNAEKQISNIIPVLIGTLITTTIIGILCVLLQFTSLKISNKFLDQANTIANKRFDTAYQTAQPNIPRNLQNAENYNDNDSVPSITYDELDAVYDTPERMGNS